MPDRDDPWRVRAPDLAADLAAAAIPDRQPPRPLLLVSPRDYALLAALALPTYRERLTARERVRYEQRRAARTGRGADYMALARRPLGLGGRP